MVIPHLSQTSVDFYCRQPVVCFAVHVMFDGACLIKEFPDVNYVIITVCVNGNFCFFECDVITVLYRMVMCKILFLNLGLKLGLLH